MWQHSHPFWSTALSCSVKLRIGSDRPVGLAQSTVLWCPPDSNHCPPRHLCPLSMSRSTWHRSTSSNSTKSTWHSQTLVRRCCSHCLSKNASLDLILNLNRKWEYQTTFYSTQMHHIQKHKAFILADHLDWKICKFRLPFLCLFI